MKEKKPIASCASSGHINKLKQSIFAPSISMVVALPKEPRQLQPLTALANARMLTGDNLKVVWTEFSTLK